MSADASRRVEGIVTAQLPSGLYQVQVDGEHRVTAHPTGSVERNFVRLLVGDRVIVELTARDGTRGRIVRKTLSERRSPEGVEHHEGQSVGKTDL
jgi:translation initiation factor IF-1